MKILVVALGFVMTLAANPAASVRVERVIYLMGTRAVLVTEATDRPAGLRRLERMVGLLEATEAELSTWRDDSLLSALNRQPVRVPWLAPASLCDLLAQLVAWHRETGGAFDPAIGALVDVWGLRRQGAVPSAAVLARARARVGLRHVTVEPGRCAITRLRDVTIDAGAFGKGEALDRISEDAESNAPGRTASWMISLGGQVAVGGLSSVEEGWPVAIAHPVRRAEPALEVRLATGSLATSAGTERDRWIDDRRIGHVLDPRSGNTVNRSASVTVWHEQALVADVLSTALYVMGVQEGLAWAETRGMAAVYLIPEEGAGVRVRATSAFGQRFLESGNALSIKE